MYVLRKNDNIILRRIHGSVFLINITDNYSGDKCVLYEINETGEFIWNHIDGHRSVDELVEMLQETIVDEVPYEILKDDVQEYVSDLKSRGFVLEVTVNG